MTKGHNKRKKIIRKQKKNQHNTAYSDRVVFIVPTNNAEETLRYLTKKFSCECACK